MRLWITWFFSMILLAERMSALKHAFLLSAGFIHPLLLFQHLVSKMIQPFANESVSSVWDLNVLLKETHRFSVGLANITAATETNMSHTLMSWAKLDWCIIHSLVVPVIWHNWAVWAEGLAQELHASFLVDYSITLVPYLYSLLYNFKYGSYFSLILCFTKFFVSIVSAGLRLWQSG